MYPTQTILNLSPWLQNVNSFFKVYSTLRKPVLNETPAARKICES